MTCLGLGFLISKMERIIVPASQDCREDYTVATKSIRIVPGILQNASCNFSYCPLSCPCHRPAPPHPERPGITGCAPLTAAWPASLRTPSPCPSSYDTCPSYLEQGLGSSTRGPLREKPQQADFMNCSHFPLSRLMAQLPTVSPSVVAANDSTLSTFPLHLLQKIILSSETALIATWY